MANPNRFNSLSAQAEYLNEELDKHILKGNRAARTRALKSIQDMQRLLDNCIQEIQAIMRKGD